jgi:ketosteroid isomerase-like protein
MSARQEEIVSGALDAIARRDLPELLLYLDPEIQLHPLHSTWESAYAGHEGIERWWADVAQIWDEFMPHTEELRNEGEDTLVARVHWRGRPKGSATELDGPAAAVIGFRGDKILSLSLFADEARALDSLG